jgi:hypothetical protein
MKYTTLILGISVALLSCDTSAVNRQQEENVIQYKETVALPTSGTLTFAEVEDSRCPKDVQCVWAGNAIVDLQLRSEQANQEAQTVKMCLGDCNSLYSKTGFWEADTAQVSLAGTKYTLILTNVSPYPNSTKTAKKEDYTIKLKIQ